MKRHFSLSHLLALFVISDCLSLTGSAAGANLLTNGRFESGNYSGWNVNPAGSSYMGIFTNPAAHQSITGSQEGLNYVAFDLTIPPAFTVESIVNDYMIGQTVSLIGGQEYAFSGWFANAGDLGFNQYPDVGLSIDGNSVSRKPFGASDGVGLWYELSANFTPGVSGNYNFQAWTYASSGSSGNDGGFDNFSVIAVPEPSGALLCGIAGLLGILRRRNR